MHTKSIIKQGKVDVLLSKMYDPNICALTFRWYSTIAKKVYLIWIGVMDLGMTLSLKREGFKKKVMENYNLGTDTPSNGKKVIFSETRQFFKHFL